MPADNDRSPDDVVLPVHAETVSITKRRTADQVVRVATQTRMRNVMVDEALTHHGVVVEHVPVGRYVEAMPAVREEGDLTILPVVEEEVVVTRRLLLREEIHVRRVKSTEHHRETLTVREQQVAVTREALDPVTTSTAAMAAADLPIHTATVPAASYQSIVAIYDTPAHAELALNDLLEAGVPLESVHRHTSAGSYAGGSAVPAARETQGRGFWSSLLGGDIGDDHLVYDGTLQRGGTVVTVTGVPDHDYPTVLAILESHQPVNLDDNGAASAVPDMTATARFPVGEDLAAGPLALVPPNTAGTSSAPGLAAPEAAALPAGDSGTVQLAEESLTVGKRWIEGGGTRIRRYVVETPVSQDLTLHSETVTVERRPVLDGRSVADEEFTDKIIEMIETVEEAIVSKTARVVEEITLHKEVSDRVETVHETVRKEAVEIEQIAAAAITPLAVPGSIHD